MTICVCSHSGSEILMQKLMNVIKVVMIVVLMLLVPTLLMVITAHVSMDTLEMEQPAPVKHSPCTSAMSNC